LATERQKRTDDLKALGTELKEALKSLEKRHRKLEETAGLADAELRDQLLQTGNTLSAELSRTADRISTELDRSASELRADKVDKSVLASALNEMATKLTSNGHAGTVAPQG
jgi:vacuolar-type H+-ATPase subunit I/STV1